MDASPLPGQHLLSLSTAYRASQLLYVAAKLGIADVLANGSRTADEIAGAVDASPDAMARTMRGLVMLGVFDQQEDGRFALNEVSQLLVVAEGTGLRDRKSTRLNS